MLIYPQTTEEAKKVQYGAWAGLPHGHQYRASQCAYEVSIPGSMLFAQCSRKPGHGPGQLYGVAHCGDIDWPGYAEKQQEWEANARLISAAPDLYAALADLSRIVESLATGGTVTPPEDQYARLVALDALAKARGET